MLANQLCQDEIALLTGGCLPNSEAVREFDDWIEGLLRRYGTKRAVAKLAGLSEGAFWRQVSHGKLGHKPLLRLAAETGESASAVLRRAQKGDLAELIEKNYGPPQTLPTHVRRFAEATEPPIPASFVEHELATLENLRASLLQQSAGDTPVPAVQAATTGKRAKRAVRGR